MYARRQTSRGPLLSVRAILHSARLHCRTTQGTVDMSEPPVMFDGEKAVYSVDYEDGEPARYTPYNEMNFDDRPVTVKLLGEPERTYWAKAIGEDEHGFTTYK